MKHRYQKPHSSISQYVRTLVILEGAPPPGADQLPLFTNSIPTLFCKFNNETGNESTGQLTLYGKTTPPECWAIDGDSIVIAYFFNPFVMAALFNLPAASIVKEPIELCGWNAHKTNALQTQLVYAATITDKINVLDNLLIHQVEQNKRDLEIVKYATDHMLSDPGTEILSSIPGRLNITERTFQRIFKKYVGVTPSQYRRICQFKLSFTQLKAGKFDKLTDVAFDNGFADQSHFIRSFKEFTQTTPQHYLKSGLKRKNK